MKRKNVFSSAMWILAIMALVVSLGGCNNGTTDVGGSGRGPKSLSVKDLPDFPEESEPATEDSVDAILAELANSYLLSNLYFEANGALWDRIDEIYNYKGDYPNISDYEKKGFIINAKFSSDYKSSRNIDEIFDLLMSFDYDFDDDYSKPDLDENTIKQLMKISLKSNDHFRDSDNETIWWETTEDKVNYSDTVTVLEGFSFFETNSYKSEGSVAKTGNFIVAEVNYSSSRVSSVTAGLTVDTPTGSAKIIFDMKTTSSTAVKNISLMDLFYDIFGEYDPAKSYSGSLTVYGSDDSPVYTITIKDDSTAKEALSALGLGYVFY